MAVSTVPAMIHPWRRLRALEHIVLRWHDPGHHHRGWTDFERNEISVRSGMDQAHRRSTVMHEVLHAERGPAPVGLAGREEVRVWKEAARLLLPDVRVVGEALAWSQGDVEAAADELWVCADTLRVRLRYLHPAERGWLKERLEDEE